MLKLSHVKKTFNKGTVTEKRALTGVDLTLNDGDFVTVIGGNGAGKSTLLNMIAGVSPSVAASVAAFRGASPRPRKMSTSSCSSAWTLVWTRVSTPRSACSRVASARHSPC